MDARTYTISIDINKVGRSRWARLGQQGPIRCIPLVFNEGGVTQFLHRPHNAQNFTSMRYPDFACARSGSWTWTAGRKYGRTYVRIGT